MTNEKRREERREERFKSWGYENENESDDDQRVEVVQKKKIPGECQKSGDTVQCQYKFHQESRQKKQRVVAVCPELRAQGKRKSEQKKK